MREHLTTWSCGYSTSIFGDKCVWVRVLLAARNSKIFLCSGLGRDLLKVLSDFWLQYSQSRNEVEFHNIYVLRNGMLVELTITSGCTHYLHPQFIP